ncbi:MAG TPA: acyl-ACP thioesterase [Treponema sp.]|nr:acyl-ACP thioesterase [Treponema sp.]
MATFEKLTFTSEREISSAFIDSTVRMGIAQSVLMVQDNLTECFNAMGCDGVVYREKFNDFWVFTKTKVHFERRPDWREIVTARTFPIDNLGMRTHVNTEIADKNGKRLLVANQEACVLSLESHRPQKLTELPYPKENFPSPVYNETFERFPSDFKDEEFVFEQIIRSCHIDMSHHMNNIEYIKLALCVFDDDFLQSHEIKDLEVHYTGESREGQTLKVFRRNDAEIKGKTYIHIKESDRCVFECCVRF